MILYLYLYYTVHIRPTEGSIPIIQYMNTIVNLYLYHCGNNAISTEYRYRYRNGPRSPVQTSRDRQLSQTDRQLRQDAGYSVRQLGGLRERESLDVSKRQVGGLRGRA
jgi:hypothetical protein